MNSKLEKMTLPKLVELKTCVWDLIESYTNELMTYGFMNNEDYIRTMATPREKEYIVSTSPLPTATYYLTLKDNLVTGTYKLVYKLYDGNTYIGETYEYMIIK